MVTIASRRKLLNITLNNTFYRPVYDIPNSSRHVRHKVHDARSSGSYFISTPIFYVNSSPHIGHLYSAVLADALARWRRLHTDQVLFSLGTDEHGLKVQQSAAKQGKEPARFCTDVSAEFKRLFNAASVQYTDFIRTTEPRHKDAVHTMWQRLVSRGHIYRGLYKGWYSTTDEAFVQDVMDSYNKQGDIIKVCSETHNPVEWIEEDNYMFRLSAFSSRLSEWLDQGVIQPAVFEGQVRGWLAEGLPDLSVSRHASRLKWGIPVPGDDTQTIYVWLDALVNYLTVGGYPEQDMWWPADCHVIGKDILRFHAVYWPAFLMAADLPLPRCILCHSHWTLDHLKMSKSRGNVVDPFDRMARYSSDGLRYFLLREGVPQSDGNYNDERVVSCLNSELVNSLGNLVSRCCAPALNPEQVVPCWEEDLFHQRASQEDLAMLQQLRELPGLVDRYYGEFQIYRALEAIILQIHQTNAFMQRHQPWLLQNTGTDTEWLNQVLATTLETLRITGILLQPVIPNLTNTLLARLNVPITQWTFAHAQGPLKSGERSLGESHGVLMARIKP